jgi:hypothetical protein
MRQFVLVAFITMIGFAAGSAAGIYFERHQPLPPAPGSLGAELGGHHPAPLGYGGQPFNRSWLKSELAKLGPQMEDYKRKVDAIDAEFEASLVTVVTPEQMHVHTERIRKRMEQNRTGAVEPEVMTDDQISHLLQWSSYQVLRTVVIEFRLQDLTREMKLTEGQQMQVHQLLRHRRDEMIALVDSVPPPSVQLVTLAPFVQRLAPTPVTTHRE